MHKKGLFSNLKSSEFRQTLGHVIGEEEEFDDEADLDDLVWTWGDASCDTAPYGKGKVATYFLAETARTDVVLPVDPHLGHPEHHEGRWVDLDAAADLLPARLQVVWTWARGVLEA